MLSFPFGSRTVATGALNVLEPYRCSASSRLCGSPDGTCKRRKIVIRTAFGRGTG